MTSNDETTRKRQRLRVCTITKIIEDTPSIKTLLFNDNMSAQAGQFVMVWIPGVDEIPMSVSFTGPEKGITVAAVGTATTKLHELSLGDKLGIRGPYGKGFDISNAHRILMVSGGCGSAPLGPLLDEAVTTGKELLFVVGARTSSELLFKTRAKELGIGVELCTDDGSEGHHGFVTERVAELLQGESFDLIVSCGPEPMLKKLLELADRNKIKIQASLERYMKCGVGICDSCTVNGYQVCRDGPVFDGETLTKLGEFGKTRRDSCGRLVEV